MFKRFKTDEPKAKDKKEAKESNTSKKTEIPRGLPTLVVSNIPVVCTENHLKDFFQQSAPVKSVKITGNRTHNREAHVKFSSRENGK